MAVRVGFFFFYIINYLDKGSFCTTVDSKTRQNKKSILYRGAHVIADILPFQGLNGPIIIFHRHIHFFFLNNGITRACLRIVGNIQ